MCRPAMFAQPKRRSLAQSIGCDCGSGGGDIVGCETTHSTRKEHLAQVSLFYLFLFLFIFRTRTASHFRAMETKKSPPQCQLYSPEIYLANAVLLSVGNEGRAKCGTRNEYQGYPLVLQLQRPTPASFRNPRMLSPPRPSQNSAKRRS